MHTKEKKSINFGHEMSAKASIGFVCSRDICGNCKQKVGTHVCASQRVLCSTCVGMLKERSTKILPERLDAEELLGKVIEQAFPGGRVRRDGGEEKEKEEEGGNQGVDSSGTHVEEGQIMIAAGREPLLPKDKEPEELLTSDESIDKSSLSTTIVSGQAENS